MSTSTRSKPASPSSRTSGDATEAEAAAEGGSGDAVEIELELSRERLWGWAIGGVVLGALLVWKLGTVGVWGGYVLIALGVYRAYLLVQTFRHPPGTIAVSSAQIRLPSGLHRGAPLEVTPGDVSAAYLLRRSVPWNRAAPVLVIELGERALTYPRDWFASEADQRRVVMALIGNCPALAEAAAAAKSAGG